MTPLPWLPVVPKHGAMQRGTPDRNYGALRNGIAWSDSQGIVWGARIDTGDQLSLYHSIFPSHVQLLPLARWLKCARNVSVEVMGTNVTTLQANDSPASF